MLVNFIYIYIVILFLPPLHSYFPNKYFYILSQPLLYFPNLSIHLHFLLFHSSPKPFPFIYITSPISLSSPYTTIPPSFLPLPNSITSHSSPLTHIISIYLSSSGSPSFLLFFIWLNSLPLSTLGVLFLLYFTL